MTIRPAFLCISAAAALTSIAASSSAFAQPTANPATDTRLTLGAGAPALTPVGVSLADAPNDGSPIFLGREPFARTASLKSWDAPRGRQAGSVPDADIARNVSEALAKAEGLDGNVEVHVRNGVVSLGGRVASAGMIYRIIALVERVDGVVGVDEKDLDVG